MNWRLHILGLLLLSTLLHFLGEHFFPTEPAAAAPAAAASAPVTEDELFAPEARARQWATHQSRTAVRVEKLGRMETDLEKVEQAARRMESSRRVLQAARQQAWTAMLQRHQAAYRQLLGQASRQPHGTVPCTLCDGLGYMVSCLLCRDPAGRCVTCHGTGHVGVDDVCPTCTGKGECFACNGTSRMHCPFCDDGEIRAGYRPPPERLPID
jgi:hypothetical protein